jgi:tRNA threonylcarbamoyl adenosine modification protein (Sua5/YciO/YrdC/YwlC family)
MFILKIHINLFIRKTIYLLLLIGGFVLKKIYHYQNLLNKGIFKAKMTQIITDINLAADEILKGNIVGIPTETVYGLGANALDADAVIKIFEAKDRPRFNPLIVHLLNKDNLDEFVKEIPDNFLKLYEKFSPGPITYVLKKKKIISDIVTAGNETVAVRFPSHKVFRELSGNCKGACCRAICKSLW